MRRGVARLLMPQRQLRQQVRHHRLPAMLCRYRPLRLIWRRGAHSVGLRPRRDVSVLNQFPILFAPHFQLSIGSRNEPHGTADALSNGPIPSGVIRELVLQGRATKRIATRDARLPSAAPARWSGKFAMQTRIARVDFAGAAIGHRRPASLDLAFLPSFNRRHEGTTFAWGHSYDGHMLPLAIVPPPSATGGPVGGHALLPETRRAALLQTGVPPHGPRIIADRHLRGISRPQPWKKRPLFEPSRRYQPRSYAEAGLHSNQAAAPTSIHFQQPSPRDAIRAPGSGNRLASNPVIDFRRPAVPVSRHADTNSPLATKAARPAAPLDIDYLSREIWKRFEARARLEAERYGRG